MKQILTLIFIFCGVSFTTVANTTYVYVSPDGKPDNNGTIVSPIDIHTAIATALPGNQIVLQGGLYSIEYVGKKNTIFVTQNGNETNKIIVRSEEGSRAVIDFSFPEGEWIQDSFGLDISGSYWSFNGIDITRAGYQGVYVKGAHNTFENCRFYKNRNTGFEINKGGSYTTVVNCDSYRNYDPKKDGSMADGFGPKQKQGPGNIFIGCRSWENSDDGYDTYDSTETVIFKNCWAFRNGINVMGYEKFRGNANGFKVGGNRKQENNYLENCIVFEQPQKGFDQNNNTGGITFINCIAYKNSINFGLGNTVNPGQKHIIKNCISIDGDTVIQNAKEENNSWSEGFEVQVSDFISVDLSLAILDRNPDGSLPITGLFVLK